MNLPLVEVELVLTCAKDALQDSRNDIDVEMLPTPIAVICLYLAIISTDKNYISPT